MSRIPLEVYCLFQRINSILAKHLTTAYWFRTRELVHASWRDTFWSKTSRVPLIPDKFLANNNGELKSIMIDSNKHVIARKLDRNKLRLVKSEIKEIWKKNLRMTRTLPHEIMLFRSHTRLETYQKFDAFLWKDCKDQGNFTAKAKTRLIYMQIVQCKLEILSPNTDYTKLQTLMETDKGSEKLCWAMWEH